MDWLTEHLWSVWLGVAVVLGIAEMMSLDLVLIMLAMGALIGMVAALVGLPFVAQALLAGGGAVAMLVFVRPSMAARLHRGPELTLGHNKLIGQTGLVTAELSGTTSGRIRIDGEVWSAQPYDDDLVIGVGEQVEVLEIRGATAYVHPVARLGG